MEYELNGYMRKQRNRGLLLAAAIKKQTVNGKIICGLCGRSIQDECIASDDHLKPVSYFTAKVCSGELSKEEARRQCQAQDNCCAAHYECNDKKNGQSLEDFLADEMPAIRLYTEKELCDIRTVGHFKWLQKNQSIPWNKTGIAEFIGQLTVKLNRFYVRSSCPEPFTVRYKELTNECLNLHLSPRGKQSTEVNIHFDKALAVPDFGDPGFQRYAGCINRMWLFWELVRLGFRVGEQPDVSLVRANIAQQFRERFDAGIKQLEQ